ncbi:MAG TPA: lanthionine synthetase LanC family protein [Candidatus Nanopelagicales bacterium]|nr:lanthionine synthetase LanC family protein [Candidatus Nanopelagicales bacterium]
MADAGTLREAGESAWSWVRSQVRDDDGPWAPEWVRDEPAEPLAVDRDALYCGIAGWAPLLTELARHRAPNAEEQVLRDAVVQRLGTEATRCVDASLYVGTAGHACALAELGADARPALAHLSATVGDRGWPDPGGSAYVNDVIGGTAGIVLAGCYLGGSDGLAVASAGADRLLRTAVPTEDGLDWAMAPEHSSLMPNFSHGTAGVSTALVVAGAALRRDDLVEAALAGTRHLLGLADLSADGFVLPMVIPPQEDRERVTFGWCHGPTGTSYLFAALAHAGVESVDGFATADLRARCIRAVMASGVPARVRPGFWDNDGRCCGTAGVGEMLLDAAQDADDPTYAAWLLDSAVVMADAILARSITDEQGTRWRSVEHRNEDPLLPPNTTWMQGAAGIAAFLLRLSRVLADGLRVPVVAGPDRWWAVPEALRVPLGG